VSLKEIWVLILKLQREIYHVMIAPDEYQKELTIY